MENSLVAAQGWGWGWVMRGTVEGQQEKGFCGVGAVLYLDGGRRGEGSTCVC